MVMLVSLTSRKTQLSLMLIGAALGAGLFPFATYHLVGATAKTLAVFLGTVWVTVMAFAAKVADVTEAPALSPSEHRELEAKTRQAVKRVWLFAGGNVVAALCVLLPSVMVDGRVVVHQWMAALAGCGAGFSVFSVIAQAAWQEELRQFRSELRERERKEKALQAISDKLSNSSVLTEEERATIRAGNVSVMWPPPSKGPH